MKNLLTKFVEFLQAEAEQDEINSEAFPVSDDIRITVKGMPQGLPKHERNQLIVSLVRNTIANLPDRLYQAGERIYSGSARLKIRDHVYELEYTLDALRVFTALHVYKQAFDAVLAGADIGIYDRDLAEITAEHIKRSAWEEVALLNKTEEPQNSTEKVTGRMRFPLEDEASLNYKPTIEEIHKNKESSNGTHSSRTDR